MTHACDPGRTEVQTGGGSVQEAVSQGQTKTTLLLKEAPSYGGGQEGWKDAEEKAAVAGSTSPLPPTPMLCVHSCAHTFACVFHIAFLALDDVTNSLEDWPKEVARGARGYSHQGDLPGRGHKAQRGGGCC